MFLISWTYLTYKVLPLVYLLCAPFLPCPTGRFQGFFNYFSYNSIWSFTNFLRTLVALIPSPIYQGLFFHIILWYETLTGCWVHSFLRVGMQNVEMGKVLLLYDWFFILSVVYSLYSTRDDMIISHRCLLEVQLPFPYRQFCQGEELETLTPSKNVEVLASTRKRLIYF